MTTAMPSVKTLFLESWETLKASFGSMFILSLLGSIVGIILFFSTMIGIAGVGFLSVLSQGSDKTKMLTSIESYLTPTVLGHIGLALIIAIICSIVIKTVTTIAIYIAIAKSADKPNIGTCLGSGISLLIPVVVMGLVTSVIGFGSWFLLIIPAILIGLFFQFVTYELVLGEKKWFSSLSGSVQIMSQHFGEVLIRMFALWGVVYLGMYLPIYILRMIVAAAAKSAPAEALGVNLILGIVQFIFGIVVGFYSVVYSVKTYQHAKSVTDTTIKPKMTWIWVVSIVGWLIAIMLGSQIVKAIKSPYVQDKIKTALSQAKSTTTVSPASATQAEKIATWKAAINSAALPYWNTSLGLFQQMKAESNPTVAKKLADQNITALQKAVVLDSGNPELWGALSDANTWMSTKGSLQAALTAAQKAETLDPTIWSYEYRTATTLMMLGRYDEAILKLQQVIRAEDNYGPAHISLGIAYKNNGIKDQAKIEIQKGIDILTKYNTNGDLDAQILDAQKELATIK